MDQELGILSAAATLITTDARGFSRRGFAELLRSSHPGQAGTLDAELETVPLELLTVRLFKPRSHSGDAGRAVPGAVRPRTPGSGRINPAGRDQAVMSG